MDETFDSAMAFVFRYEGGYSDHPKDPGGATNLGITHGVLAQWRGCSVSKDDVRDLTRAEAENIYKARYWKPAHCDALPVGVDLAVFDCAVNQGVSRAVLFLQTAARVTADGMIGPITLAAVTGMDRWELLDEYAAQRMRGYGTLTRLFKTFGLGWSRRLMACHSTAGRLMQATPAGEI